MFAYIALLGLSAWSGSDARHLTPAPYRPHVEVWTTRGEEPFQRGDGVRVYIRADQDAYVTLFRLDTDGRVRVLYPREPWEDNFVRGGRELEIQGYDSPDLFRIDDYPGVGYLFAVAAADPFTFDPIESGDHWDYRVIADGRVRGDPYVALTDLAQRIVPAGDEDWDYDMVPYYVERHYDYPRFLCYDCHSYATWTSWDPYAYSCVRFRIVVYDDPYYYPYRYYGGRRVVFARPFRPQPRFIFKDRDGVGDDRFVTRERQRPVNDDTRRSVGVTRRDIGGVIPPPRQFPPRQRRDQPDDPGSRGGRDRPDHPDHPDRPGRPDHPDPPDHRGDGRRDRPDQMDRPGGRGDHPDQPDHRGGGRPDRMDRPDQIDRPQIAPPSRPPDDRGRGRGDPGGSRPQAEPRRDPPPPRAEPRREAPPSRDKDKGKDNQPELRRRRP
jgi:hypothetical protein